MVQGLPEGTQQEPKVNARREKGIEGHPKEAKKSQNNIHAKTNADSRSTAIQRPAINIHIENGIDIKNINANNE